MVSAVSHRCLIGRSYSLMRYSSGRLPSAPQSGTICARSECPAPRQCQAVRGFRLWASADWCHSVTLQLAGRTVMIVICRPNRCAVSI